nr:RHS repeat-associated core domain-containing protein [Frigoribacterium sp. CFBP 8754]
MSTTTGSGALSATAKLEYNADGTIKTATAPGNEGNPTRYAYDANKQLSTITPPTGTSLGVKDFTYDAYGRQKTQTDGRGNTTTFTYDLADRLLQTVFSDGTPRVTNRYDTNGNLTSQVAGTGTVTNAYDQQNRLISTVNTAGGGTIGFGYDKASHETSVATESGTTTHTYDASGKLTSSTYPDGAGTATQRYATDDKGRRTDTWLATNADNTLWAAKTTTSYDSSGRISQIRAWTGTGNASNTAVFDTSYCYQASTTAPTCTATAGSDRDTIQWARDNLSGQSTTYAYTTGRLTSATQAGGASNSTWTYSYDANGNRTGETVTGANAAVNDFTFNAASQITTAGYVYDGSGNLTASPGSTYTYNGAQQMTSSTRDGITTTYTYAGTDQNQLLTEKITGGTSYGYVYGGNDSQGVPEIVAQTTSGAGTSSVMTDPLTGQALNLTTADGVTGLYLVDAIGNQVGLLTETRTTAFQVSYAPYGAQTVTAGVTSDEWQQNPYGFKNGSRTDNGVLVKFGMRWYLAITGTWTQRDTLDAPLDPRNANRYGYAGGDPVNGADPTGKYTGYCSASVGCYTDRNGVNRSAPMVPRATAAQKRAAASCIIGIGAASITPAGPLGTGIALGIAFGGGCGLGLA